jgi:hypothetical protein
MWIRLSFQRVFPGSRIQRFVPPITAGTLCRVGVNGHRRAGRERSSALMIGRTVRPERRIRKKQHPKHQRVCDEQEGHEHRRYEIRRSL